MALWQRALLTFGLLLALTIAILVVLAFIGLANWDDVGPKS
jgi:hypothetical protein